MAVPARPPLSVTRSWTSTKLLLAAARSSGAGAGKENVGPVPDAHGWVWVSWWRRTVHVKAVAGKLDCWASVAVPVTVMVSPTLNVAGDAIDTVGGVFTAPELMATVTGADRAPGGSITTSEAV